MKFKNITTVVLAVLLIQNCANATNINKNNETIKYAEINTCIEKNDYKNADAIIAQEFQKSPTDLDLKILSARSLIMQDKLEFAQDILDEIKPQALANADYYYAQGGIYLKRIETSDLRFRAKRDELIQLAVNQLTYALKIDPNNAKVYNALGVAELKREDLYKAQKYFEKAIALNPQYATAYDNLGSIYYLTNELDKAAPYYEKALKLNPSSATIYYHLAQISLKNEDLKKTIYYANKSLLWNDRSPYTYNLLGEAYTKQGNQAGAIVAYKKSIALLPENPYPYLNLAKIYESRGDIVSALEELKTCATLDKGNDSITLAIADLELANKNYEEAIKRYTEVKETYKLNAIDGIATAYSYLAVENAQNGFLKSHEHLNGALEYINQAINEDPNNLELYITKTKLTKLLRNEEMTKESLTKVLQAPNNTIADLIMKAEACNQLGEYRQARTIYTELIKQDKPVENNLYLAEYFMFNKQYKLAQETLKEVAAVDANNLTAARYNRFIAHINSKADENYENARYFQKRFNKFFQKVYCEKAIEFNPNHIDANLRMVNLTKDLNKKAKHYKVVLGESDDKYQLNKVAKKLKKVEKKLEKADKATKSI